ncbi:MAG TPA: zinc ribbon domain-containing protein [Chitinophagaceae bacterium]|nr:zinc ribbon domain-containing protein [Chitinophagaceae bacterium]
MEPELFCQSCTMPIDKMEDLGTEKDGSKSSEYCKYCYQHGKFTDPDLTLEKMKIIVATQMKQMNLPQAVLQQSLELLPRLKRWKLAST